MDPPTERNGALIARNDRTSAPADTPHSWDRDYGFTELPRNAAPSTFSLLGSYYTAVNSLRLRRISACAPRSDRAPFALMRIGTREASDEWGVTGHRSSEDDKCDGQN